MKVKGSINFGAELGPSNSPSRGLSLQTRPTQLFRPLSTPSSLLLLSNFNSQTLNALAPYRHVLHPSKNVDTS